MEELAIFGGTPASDRWIPVASPSFSEKTKTDVCRVLESGMLRQGEYTRIFEERFRELVGSRYAYAVSSGTAALHSSYMSTLHPRDEVIVPAFTFFSTVSTIMLCQGKPVFTDIDPDTLLLDLEDVKEKITDKTRAITTVHLFGNAVDMTSLAELGEDHDLFILSDCAQAQGTKYGNRDVGSFDDLNCFSFYPSKIMTTGEGGIVTTNSPDLYDRGLLIRSHGEDERYHHMTLGLNYRMTEIEAAIGLNQLDALELTLSKRRRTGRILRNGIKSINAVKAQRFNDEVEPSYCYFSVILDLDVLACTRDEFVCALKAENIDSAVHYPFPVTYQPVIKSLMKPEPCPVADNISKRVLSLPIHPNLSEEDLSAIIKGVAKVSEYYQL